MSEFCKQCAEDLGFPRSDFAEIGRWEGSEPLKTGEGYGVLCEGCGPTRVDAIGTCLDDCLEHHNKGKA